MTDYSISKIDNDRRLVFGWAQVAKDKDGNVILDHDGDFIDDIEHLENAAYDFVLKSRDGGVDHVRRGVSTLVESVMLTKEKMAAMGIPEGHVPEAWWVGFKVHDDTIWKGVKEGRYKMFSVHGKGKRKSREPEGPVKVATRKSRAEVVELGKSPSAMAADLLDRKKKLNSFNMRPRKYKPIASSRSASGGLKSKKPKKPPTDNFNRMSLPHNRHDALAVIQRRRSMGLMKMDDHGPSIKNPRVYEALRRKGYSKSKAAAISNGQLHKSGPTSEDVHVVTTGVDMKRRRKKSEEDDYEMIMVKAREVLGKVKR